MGKFSISKRINLGFIGEDWENCYMDFETVSVKEAKQLLTATQNNEEAIEKTLELIESKFIGGKGITKDKKIVELKKGDLDEFPLFVIEEVMRFLSRSPQQQK